MSPWKKISEEKPPVGTAPIVLMFGDGQCSVGCYSSPMELGRSSDDTSPQFFSELREFTEYWEGENILPDPVYWLPIPPL